MPVIDYRYLRESSMHGSCVTGRAAVHSVRGETARAANRDMCFWNARITNM
jgi:hypothetical protein